MVIFTAQARRRASSSRLLLSLSRLVPTGRVFWRRIPKVSNQPI
jgi:hypothetical protein